MNRPKRRARLRADDPILDGDFVQGRLCGCILCGDDRGETRLTMQIVQTPEGRAYDDAGTRCMLCPDCRGDRAIPLSFETHARIDAAAQKLLTSPELSGCPCCSWGVLWEPCDAPPDYAYGAH